MLIYWLERLITSIKKNLVRSMTRVLQLHLTLKSFWKVKCGPELVAICSASGDDTEHPVPSVVHGATRCYHEVLLQYAQYGATRSGVVLQDATTWCYVPQDATPPPFCPNQYKTLLPSVKCDDGVKVTLRRSSYFLPEEINLSWSLTRSEHSIKEGSSFEHVIVPQCRHQGLCLIHSM